MINEEIGKDLLAAITIYSDTRLASGVLGDVRDDAFKEAVEKEIDGGTPGTFHIQLMTNTIAEDVIRDLEANDGIPPAVFISHVANLTAINIKPSDMMKAIWSVTGYGFILDVAAMKETADEVLG